MNNNLKQEVINLLPWYHLGKLTDEENTLVEEALANDPSLKEVSVAEEKMMRSVQADKTLMNGSIFEDPTARLDSVLAKLDGLEQAAPVATQEQETPAVVTKKASVFAQIKDYLDELLSGNSRSFTYAVFAALTVVQLALLVLFIVPSDNIDHEGRSSYGLASHDTQAVEQPSVASAPSGQMVLLIGMNSHFNAAGFDEIIGDNVEVKFLPDSHGYYRVRVNKKLSEQEIEELKHELSKKHGTIWFIGEETPQ